MLLWQCVNTQRVLSIPMLCVLHMAYLTSSGRKYQVLMGVFSEHLCFTGNSVSSEHPPCFHYFGLAQPTTDKQIEECTKRPRSSGLLNIYLILSLHLQSFLFYYVKDISSVAAFCKNSFKLYEDIRIGIFQVFSLIIFL